MTRTDNIVFTAPDARPEQAVRAVDDLLRRRAGTLPGSLPPEHSARIIPWQSPLREIDGIGHRYSPEEFTQLDALARHVEVLRASAEAMVVHETAGFVLLSDTQREHLVLRALGILPDREPERFAEIAVLHDLSPKHILVAPAHFLEGIRSIEQHYSLSTALAYALLLAAGIRSMAEMTRYGELLQKVYDDVVQASSVSRTLARLGATGMAQADVEVRMAILTQVREQVVKRWPRRPGIEFRLTRVLEAATAPGGVIAASNLGVTALDALILSRFGFPLRLTAVEDRLYLEIIFPGRSFHWDSESAAPLFHLPLRGSRKADVLELLPMNYHQIGVWYMRQGHMTRALATFKLALALKPDMPETFNEIGQTYLRTNQPNEAAAAGLQAVQLKPTFAEAYITLASAQLTQQRPDEAIETLKKAIRVKPDMAEAYNNLGFAYEMRGESDQAIPAYKSALRIRPEYAQAHYNLGNSYMNKRQYDLALAEYQTTVKLNPNFVRAFYNMGQAYYARGALDDASEAYKKVLKINPKHAGALYNLGIIYRDKGMTEKAVEVLEKAVALNPNLLR